MYIYLYTCVYIICLSSNAFDRPVKSADWLFFKIPKLHWFNSMVKGTLKQYILYNV